MRRGRACRGACSARSQAGPAGAADCVSAARAASTAASAWGRPGRQSLQAIVKSCYRRPSPPLPTIAAHAISRLHCLQHICTTAGQLPQSSEMRPNTTAPRHMKTTTAPAAIVPAEFIGWDRFDWLESYEDATYERSVIWATDDNCRLAECDLEALFKDHGADCWEYRAHCTGTRLQPRARRALLPRRAGADLARVLSDAQTPEQRRYGRVHALGSLGPGRHAPGAAKASAGITACHSANAKSSANP